MIEQLSFPGFDRSVLTRAEMEAGVIDAAMFCEGARYVAWLKRHDDGLARRSLRWRRRRSLEGAAYWSGRAFAIAKAYFL